MPKKHLRSAFLIHEKTLCLMYTRLSWDKTHNDRCHDGPVDHSVWYGGVVHLPTPGSE